MRLALMMLTICVAGTAFAQPAPPLAPPHPGLTLAATSFEDSGVIPKKYTQSDPNPVSPALHWTNVPTGVVSFALIMHDPDTAPEKGVEDILHWMAFNIPSASTGLPEAVPTNPTLPDETIQAKSFRGKVGYMDPGAGVAGPYHHYTWELYALDIKLDLGPDATRADVLKAMDGHVLAKAALSARFHR